MPVEHSLATNRATENIVVQVGDDQGRRGFGEGVPRSYVTGETTESSLGFLQESLAPALIGAQMDPAQALDQVAGLVSPAELDRYPAAACALETALLDLAGQALSQPLSWFLGGQARAEVIYSGVAPLLPLPALERILGVMAALGLSEVKVKVGREDDLERLGLVRRVLGSGVRLRVDANGAWGPAEAVEKIGAMAGLGVESVEQPVPGQDLEGLLEVSRRVRPLILADESLCTLEQAGRIVVSGARVGFNLRLSKCGGPARTLELLRLARRAGLPCQLGCQVGELGLLSAAGRHFAAAAPDLLHLEGSLTRFYLDQDLIAQDLSFGRQGRAPALAGPGLGVQTLEDHLAGCRLFSAS